MTNTTAPDLTPGYPSNGAKLGPAWNDLYAELTEASRRGDSFIDGRELANEIAPKHDLAPVTLIGLLSRAAAAGVLERKGKAVKSARGNRTRTHYRIPQNV